MKLEHSFEVDAPVEAVWEKLIDVEQVAPCLPGAEVTGVDENGVFQGNFTVKLGPTTAAYRGKLEMEEVDPAAHRAVMKANGQDKRGQGSANATIVSVLAESEGRTRVEVDTEFTLTGRLARFGRGGMIKDVSNRLLQDFSSCLAASIERSHGEGANQDAGAVAHEARAIRGFSLFLSVLWERLKRIFRRLFGKAG